MPNECYAEIEGIVFGPMSRAKLKEFAQKGWIGPGSRVRRGMNSKWVRADQVKGLQPLLATPAHTRVPRVWSHCPDSESNRGSDDGHRLSNIAAVITTVIVFLLAFLNLIVLGVTPLALLLGLALVFTAVFLAWFVYELQGKKISSWLVDAFRVASISVKDWNRERIERKRRAEEKRRLHSINRHWSSKSGVDASRAKTYGLGGQYVYCYSLNSRLELAHIKQSPCCSIKIGMASGDPIDHIWQQISASKTAISEAAVVLLIFQTNDCSHLESWLHKQLKRDTAAHGREWFLTSENELVRLFRIYVREYS